MKLRQKIALELARKIRNNDKQLHVLRQLFWESTLRCNVHCRHCGSDCKAAEQTPDMPFADFLRAIDSITPHVDPHKVMIIISGANHWCATIWNYAAPNSIGVVSRGEW